MQALKEQARNIIDKAVRDAKLHRAECRLLRKRGHVYHLYERNNGSTYMALLSVWVMVVMDIHELAR